VAEGRGAGVIDDDYPFAALAQYNSECARGIVHTAEYDEQMAQQQRQFEASHRQRLLDEGYEQRGDFWIGPSAPLDVSLIKRLSQRLRSA
jgi:hypothetical protein